MYIYFNFFPKGNENERQYIIDLYIYIYTRATGFVGYFFEG